MPRAKDAPTRVGGQIDPYVQRSIQQSKQLAESRLVAAMQEAGAAGRTAMQQAGATERAGIQEAGATGRAVLQDVGVTRRMGMQERGATERAGIQAATQRGVAAARTTSEDRRAAEDERSKREDRKYTQTMTEASQKFQAKQADLEREFQIARQERDWNRTDKLEKKRDAFRRFDSRMRMRTAKENINAILTMAKGMGKRELLKEKTETTMMEEVDKFNKDKKIYETTKKEVIDLVRYDKRLDFPARKPRAAFRGAGIGMSFPSPAEPQENLANPMGVLQDQIIKQEGKISLEDLSSANIHKIVEKMQAGELKTENINTTLGVLEGMKEIIDEKRFDADRKSDEFDFWQDTYLEIDQFVDNLERLINKTDKKITGSETETVGGLMEYILGTKNDRSLGGLAARQKDLMGGSLEGLLEAWTESIQIPSLMPITDDMSVDELNLTNEHNIDLISIYPELEGVE